RSPQGPILGCDVQILMFDWPASPPREPPVGEELQRAKEAVMSSDGDRQSLDAMGLLLDKLAKENQDIRLMQAELQAQKEELQLLLRKTEGENSRLAEALKRETASLLATRAELHLLQEKLAEAGDSKSQPRPEKLPSQDRQREKAERPEGYFGNDGAFAHDRLSFVELLDEVEDALEELAEQLGGSEEEADNFEEVILRQLGAAPAEREGSVRTDPSRSPGFSESLHSPHRTHTHFSFIFGGGKVRPIGRKIR
uniref:PBX homeobox interacting protein 1 n=1 Tax=Podarcis muralis TaxID=64176 RepID=A0A670JKW4_PODMU